MDKLPDGWRRILLDHVCDKFPRQRRQGGEAEVAAIPKSRMVAPNPNSSTCGAAKLKLDQLNDRELGKLAKYSVSDAKARFYEM